MTKAFDPTNLDEQVGFSLAVLMISFIIRGKVWSQMAVFARELATRGYSDQYINDAIQYAARCA